MAGHIRVLTTIIVVAVAGCSDTTGPNNPEAQPQRSAIRTSGTGVFTVDAVTWHPCLGEVVHTVLHAPYTFHLVRNPNGEYVYHEQWDSHAITGTVTGLTSGTVWTRERFVSPYTERSAGGGMTHYTFGGFLVNESGVTVQVREVFHVSRNATGEL